MARPNVDSLNTGTRWRRAARALVDRMTKAQAAAVALIMLVFASLGDAALDSFTLSGPFTALYMIPVGFAAWTCGTSCGIATAFVVCLVEGFISNYGLHHRHPEMLTFSAPAIVTGAAELLSLLAIAVMMSRLRLALEHERDLSRRDPLTGLSNLRGFWEELETEVERMSRDKRPLAVVYMDVDDFKQVNDALGHDGGDEVLRAVGFTLRDSIRAIDTSARVGGDEFALVLPNADEKVASIVVERIRSKFATMLRTKDLKATLSIGVAVFHRPPMKAEATMMAADRVMYEAKHLGKNQVAMRAC